MSSIIQRSFSGGEIAPALYGRVDQVKYATGLRTCRNFIVMRHGGTQNRPGTTFVGEVKDSTKRVRLIPFIFNSDQTYVLEFGNLYMRVHRNGAQVTETAKNITGISNARPPVVTSAGHGFVNGDEVFITGVQGMTQLNGRNFKVIAAAANTFELNNMDGTPVDAIAYGAYVSGGTVARVYTITTPYLEADLAAIKFVQSADVITLVHPSYAPRELTRTGHTSWTLTAITFAPGITPPNGIANSGAAGSTYEWKVTAVAVDTLEESLPTAATQSSTNPATTPVTISWLAVSGAQEYNVYRGLNGIFGFIGTAAGLSFVDNGITPDNSDTPPIARNPFNATDDYPGAVTYFQQRLMFGNTNNNPENIWASRSANFKNFTIRSPLQDDDAVTFTVAGRQVNTVKHLVDLGELIVFTTGSEIAVGGDQSGILRPGEINPKQHSYNGSSDLAPIIVSGSAIYVQARGGVVRDLGFDDAINGYRGNDLTIFSAHLFDGYTLVDWAYQQIQHSVIWAVRSDGTLLGLTYVKEQQVLAWHRHDFQDGEVENVCCVPEGNEDAVYIVVKRTINGRSTRYVERMASRLITDILNAKFMDSSLSYDGRNTNTSLTMTLQSGTTWAADESIVIQASSAYFTADDVGNAIHITGPDGDVIRFSLDAYVGTTLMTGHPHKTVPASMRTVAFSTWAKAVDQVGALWHLEGEDVAVIGDGFVVGSPNNADYDVFTVEDGIVTLDRPYAVIHVGLPFMSDMELLDIDTPQGETVADKKKQISQVSLLIENSRGIFAGEKPPTDDDEDPLENLFEFKIRDQEEYDEPVDLTTGVVDIPIAGSWNSNGRVFIRQVDPLPLSILAAVPAGLVPFRG